MGTFIVGTVVFAIVAAAARKTYMDWKKGTACGCADCNQCAGCHTKV